MIAVVLGLVLAAGVVVLVAMPFLREPETADDRLDAPTEAESRRLELIAERDRTLSALKELEFDHRAGSISDEDYRELIGPLRQAAAAALRSLDTDSGNRSPMSDLPSEPAPPPDEGTPPTPAPVPEPYPPPDEATIPSAPQE
jgi:hypothetical protein